MKPTVERDLLKGMNGHISQELGFDFAGNAAPRGGGCCG
jgi:hypothetical protein